MRILSITAGAAGMYCGSCFRDNALAAELIARGHDVTLMPVYTPTLTDEPNVSEPAVLFGGISVYLQQHARLFRSTPRLLDRVWDSPRVIKAFAGRAVSTDARLLGELTMSMLEGERGALRKEFEKLLDWTRGEPAPDVINLPNSLLIALAAPLKHALKSPVCCTLQGEELFLDGLSDDYRKRALALIRNQVRHVDRFVAVSEYCARFMAGLLEIPHARIDVVPLGINLSGYQQREPSARASSFRVGYFARVAPEKGLHVLADAYVTFRRRVGTASVALEAAGYMANYHQSYLRDVERILEGAGLQKEFRYRGAVDRAGKLAFLRDLDVLSVPATYDEPKGMFLLEAMASGVPVVQPKRGAFTEVVERTGGGLLVQPDDADALADGLYALWHDREERLRLAARAYAGVREHYTIEGSAARLLDVYASAGAGSTSPERTPLLVVSDVAKTYPTPRGSLHVLSDVTFTLDRGDAVAITGPSGSGKSSLLYMLGALDAPTRGEITVGGGNPFAMAARELADFRNTSIGFVFQDHCLLPQCTVLENVLLPTLVAPRDARAAREDRERAHALLVQVGLGERLDHRPGELSGGEKQRVAIARALIRRPTLLLCDEPTGNLDQASAAGVAALLLDLHRREQNVLVVVTHNQELAAQFPIRFEIARGRLHRATLVAAGR